MLDKFITFFVSNIVTIIEVTFFVVIPLTIFILYRSFKNEKETLDLNVDQMKNLEDILKNHLSNLPTPKAMAVEDGPAPAAVPSSDMEKVISEKEALIKTLKDKIEQLEKSSQGNSNVDVKEWEQKVSDLKERLAEYEIIEDDIANLTFYKAENLKLKEELAKLGVKPEETTPEPPPPEATEGTAEVAGSLEALVENIAANEPEPKAEAPPPEPDNVIPMKEPETATPMENVMEDFEAAVKQKEALENATAKLDPKKSSKLAVDEDDEEHSKKPVFPVSGDLNKGDIIAEFGAAVKEAAAPEEAASTSEAAPKASEPEAEDAGVQALSVDSEKLLDEAAQIAAEPPPAPTEEPSEGDESKKLISEFEAFVKGSGS